VTPGTTTCVSVRGQLPDDGLSVLGK
jgi:hypothetical protein